MKKTETTMTKEERIKAFNEEIVPLALSVKTPHTYTAAQRRKAERAIYRDAEKLLLNKYNLKKSDI